MACHRKLQNDSVTHQIPDDKIIHIPVALYEHWKKELAEHGQSAGTAKSLPSPERVLLEAQSIRSTLLLAVPGQNQIPVLLDLTRWTPIGNGNTKKYMRFR